jgi:hypothetical protein
MAMSTNCKWRSTWKRGAVRQLVLPNQRAFFRVRAIYDNFRAVQSAAKLLHARRRLCVLIKIDIVKAFDTVAWSFLLQHMGFT